jgi:hypothetical protein
MASKLKIEKRGDEIKKKSSPLKLLSQSQPNFAEMILGVEFKKPKPNPILLLTFKLLIEINEMTNKLSNNL